MLYPPNVGVKSREKMSLPSWIRITAENMRKPLFSGWKTREIAHVRARSARGKLKKLTYLRRKMQEIRARSARITFLLSFHGKNRGFLPRISGKNTPTFFGGGGGGSGPARQKVSYPPEKTASWKHRKLPRAKRLDRIVLLLFCGSTLILRAR